MTSSDWVAVIGAVAAGIVLVVSAVGAVFVQVRKTHELVNSRMSELLEITRKAAVAEGRLAGPSNPK